jgi:hypothetical protein
MSTITTLILRTAATTQNGWTSLGHRLEQQHEERGEGVISTAIAVLIVVGLGAAMWVAYKIIFDDATARTSTGISQIGR